MPESTEVRVLAQTVAKRMNLVPWWQHRAAILPEVYRRLGLGEWSAGKKRARVTAPKRVECAVCMEEGIELVVLVPCAHKRICNGCADRCRGKCPICRCAFRSRISRIYD